MLVYSRERKWSPTEYYAQPSVFVHAHQIFLGKVVDLIAEDLEARRKKAEVTRG